MSQVTPPANPLDVLLRRLTEQADDPRVRGWADSLLAGETAEGGSALPPANNQASRTASGTT